MGRFRVEKAQGLYWGRQLVRNNTGGSCLAGAVPHTSQVSNPPSPIGTRNLRLMDAGSHFALIVLKAKGKIPPSLPRASSG